MNEHIIPGEYGGLTHEDVRNMTSAERDKLMSACDVEPADEGCLACYAFILATTGLTSTPTPPEPERAELDADLMQIHLQAAADEIADQYQYLTGDELMALSNKLYAVAISRKRDEGKL